jgi:hypothetical protein
MNGKHLFGGIAALAMVGMIFYLNNSLKQDTSTAMHSVMLHAIHEMSCYPKHQATIDAMCAKAHESAFALAYSAGGLFHDESLDDKRYVEEFFKSMSSQARSAGLTQADQELDAIHRNLLSALAENEWRDESDDASPETDDGDDTYEEET